MLHGIQSRFEHRRGWLPFPKKLALWMPSLRKSWDSALKRIAALWTRQKRFRVVVMVGLTYLMANMMVAIKGLFRKCGVCQGKQWKENESEKKMNKKLMQGLARRFNIPLDGEDLVNFNILNESVSVNETTVSVE